MILLVSSRKWHHRPEGGASHADAGLYSELLLLSRLELLQGTFIIPHQLASSSVMTLRQAACEPCRKSKLACDHKKPTCSRCLDQGREQQCVYRRDPFRRTHPGSVSRRSQRSRYCIPPPHSRPSHLLLLSPVTRPRSLSSLSSLRTDRLLVAIEIIIQTQDTWATRAMKPFIIEYFLAVTMTLNCYLADSIQHSPQVFNPRQNCILRYTEEQICSKNCSKQSNHLLCKI